MTHITILIEEDHLPDMMNIPQKTRMCRVAIPEERGKLIEARLAFSDGMYLVPPIVTMIPTEEKEKKC